MDKNQAIRQLLSDMGYGALNVGISAGTGALMGSGIGVTADALGGNVKPQDAAAWGALVGTGLGGLSTLGHLMMRQPTYSMPNWR
jgi:hypothetical protein